MLCFTLSVFKCTDLDIEMALRVCLLLALLALAKAQSTPDGVGFDAQLAADTRNLHFYVSF